MSLLAVHVRTKDDVRGGGRHGWLILDADSGEAKTFVSGTNTGGALDGMGAVKTDITIDLSVAEFGFWQEVEKKT